MVFIGAEMPIDIYSPTNITKTSSIQTTNQLTKTYAPQMSYQYAPQMILGSPNAGIGSGAGLTPQVTVTPLATPTTQNTVTPEFKQDPDMGESKDNTVLTIVALAAAGVVGYYLYKKIKKKKK